MEGRLEDQPMTTATGWQVSGPAGMLFVDDAGSSRGHIPVLLVHSFGGSSEQWAPQLEHLRKTRRAIAFDLRGHGQSGAPDDGDYAVESLAADIGAVVEALRLSKVVLVGHGLGAKAALEYAGADPGRVAGLLLAAAPARIPAGQAAQMVAGMQSDYERMSASINARLLDGARDEVRAVVGRDAARIPRDAGLRIIEASLTHDPIPALERFGGPKLALTTPDASTPNDIHRLAPDVAHEEMRGTSHWMQLDRPDEFNQILDRFLARVEEAS
jgi:pimeloyl-ACP methyl ester carboxylesterase